MKNANLRSCEEILKLYVQVPTGDTLRGKLGVEAWNALTGPAKRYGPVYTFSDCLLALSTVPLIICLYMATASNPYSIPVGLLAIALMAQWTMLFYSRQAKPEHVILDETAADKKLFMRLFFRFHRLAATGRIELLDDEDPIGPSRPIVVSPAILRGDHGWLPLLGSERGNIRLKGIWLRRPPRNLKVDLNTLTSNSEFLGELSLIQAASGRKMLAEMSSSELSALRDTLLKIDCLDDILRNSLQDIVGYQEAFETYRLKESAIRVASEQARLSGSVDGRMTRIRQLIDGKNQAVNTRLANAVETLSRCYT